MTATHLDDDRRDGDRTMGRLARLNATKRRTATGRRLWNTIYTPSEVELTRQVFPDRIEGRTREERDAAIAVMSGLLDGPFPVEHIKAMFAESSHDDGSDEFQQMLSGLGRRLNDLLFERIGELSERFFSRGERDEILSMAASPLWARWNDARDAWALALSPDGFARWERDRVTALLTQLASATAEERASITLPAVVAPSDERLAALVRASKLEVPPRTWLNHQLARLAEEPRTRRLRDDGGWEIATARLLSDDSYWWSLAHRTLHSSLREGDAIALTRYFEGAAAKRLGEFLSAINANVEGWTTAPAFRDALLSSVEAFVES